MLRGEIRKNVPRYLSYLGLCGHNNKKCEPASVAQLDASRTGNQVAGLSSAGSATFFRGDFHEIFSMVILSLLLIQEGQLSVSGARMCTILVNRLED